jgi:long-chain acyl-CoA synthetase
MSGAAPAAGGTLPRLLLRNAAAGPDRVALREKRLGIWQRITWAQYAAHVRDFALGLEALGFREGDRLAVLGDNSPEWLYADLACQALRGLTVGIYPTSVAAQVRWALSHSGARVVVCGDQEQVDKVLEVAGELPALERVVYVDPKGLRRYRHPRLCAFGEVEALGRPVHERDGARFEERVAATRPEDAAIMVYTSGTTGDPKGALIGHRNMLAMVEGLEGVVRFGPDDSLVSALPLCHIAERMFSLIFPLHAACTVNFAESIQTLQADLREISPTAFLNVPRIFEKIHTDVVLRMKDAFAPKRWVYRAMMPIGERVAGLRLARRPVPPHWWLAYALAYLLLFRPLRNQLGLLQCRIAVSGAAPLSRELALFFRAIGVPLREAYGMTESTGISTIASAGDVRVGAVGRPIPGVELRLAEDGEVLLRGPPVFLGYWRNPEATRAAFTEDGWLRTGDVGLLGPDGQLEIVDRKKDIIINSAGKNIAPSEIENRLRFSPYIKEAIVIGDRRNYLVALVQIELQTVSDWAQERGIPHTSYRSLAERPEVRGLVAGEVARVNAQLSRVENVRRFAILPKELDQDDEEVTATMKVRRKIIAERFADLIEAMYREPKA